MLFELLADSGHSVSRSGQRRWPRPVTASVDRDPRSATLNGGCGRGGPLRKAAGLRGPAQTLNGRDGAVSRVVSVATLVPTLLRT